jgi:hypothetical protein
MAQLARCKAIIRRASEEQQVMVASSIDDGDRKVFAEELIADIDGDE